MEKVKHILCGSIIIIIGVILALNAMNITNIDIFFKGWWTLLIIVPAFLGLFKKNSGKTTNLVFLIIGIMLLLGVRNIISLGMIVKLILPTVLIAIGISIIFKDTFNRKVSQEINKINKNKEGRNEYSAIFAGQDIKPSSEEFKGADLNAVFGGIELDLRNAKIEENQVINCSAIFGGIDILVPENINIEIKSNSLFGGITNRTKNKTENDKIIYINSICMFGGVDIK